MRLSEYLLMPSDLPKLGARMRRFGARDILGVMIGVLVFLFFKFLLNQNVEDSLFVAVLFGTLWWRLDPRYPLVGAIGVLILIPVLQVLSNANILLVGDTSEPLAVIAYYLLVIGVAGQVRELRAEKGSAEPEKVAPAEEPPKPKPRKPLRMGKMRDPETIKKLRANREALRHLSRR